MHILLIDDDPMAARGLARYLHSHGHEVRCGASLADAIAACDEEAFDLLIADVLLPDGTGWDLLARIGPRGAGMAAIVYSACGRPQDVAASLAAGFDAHYVKPEDLLRLPEIARQLLRHAPPPRPAPAPAGEPAGTQPFDVR
jgi:DNA-binding response OmpR family regulator